MFESSFYFALRADSGHNHTYQECSLLAPSPFVVMWVIMRIYMPSETTEARQYMYITPSLSYSHSSLRPPVAMKLNPAEKTTPPPSPNPSPCIKAAPERIQPSCSLPARARNKGTGLLLKDSFEEGGAEFLVRAIIPLRRLAKKRPGLRKKGAL